MLFGTVVNGSGSSVNLSGGAGGDGNGGIGGGGHFIIGNNAAGTFTGAATGAALATPVAGSVAANPFVAGLPTTPYIPALTDGATTSSEIYGLGDATLNQSTLGALFAGGVLPSTDVNGASLSSAGAALIRIALGAVPGSTYSNSFTGYDMLVMLNLSTGVLSSPEFGLNGADTALQLQGYTRNTAVGGTGGPVTLSSLLAGASYATLVPSGTTNNASLTADFGAGPVTVTAANLFGGGGSPQVLYLTVPEPSTFVLAWLGTAVVFAIYRRRRRA